MMRLFRRHEASGRRLFEDRVFENFDDRDSERICEDLEFRRCRFVGCDVSITRRPCRRSTVRNVKLIQCEQVGCVLWSAVVEDVLVDGFKTSGVFRAHGAVFKHVTARGKIGDILVSPMLAGGARPEQQRAFDEANAAYYATVDWALDISEAEFVDADIRGVPARLIRRDAATQMVVTRERALEGRWRELNLSGTHWPTAIQFLLDQGYPDIVLVAPKRSRKFRQLLEGLQKLRDAGVAEPD